MKIKKLVYGAQAFLLLTFAIFVVASSGYAATYYVSELGDDSNPGTQAQPWRTVQKAANTMVSGDTVYVQAGTYDEPVTTQRSGADASHYITFQGVGLPILKAVDIKHSYIKFDGFKFSLNDLKIYVWANTSYGIISNCEFDDSANPAMHGINLPHDSINHFTISNNKFHNFTNGSGYPLNIHGSYHTIENNEYYDSYQDFLRCFGTYHTIRGNYVHDVRDALGLHLDFFQNWASEDNHDIMIENNIVIGDDRTIQPCVIATLDPYVQHPERTYNYTFRNNIFVNCANAFTAAQGTVWYNNTFYNCGGFTNYVIHVGGEYATNCIIKNNLFIKCGSTEGGDDTDNVGWYTFYIVKDYIADYNYVAKGPASNWGAKSGFAGKEVHGINGGNPRFVNYATNDFHLQSGSPAIDKGATITGFNVDRDGVRRSQGSGWDIGAYEYGANLPPRPPTGLKVVQ